MLSISLEESQGVNIYKHWRITKQVMFVFVLYFFAYIWIEIHVPFRE